MTSTPLKSLPESMRYRLLAASCGKRHLAGTGRAAMAAAERSPESAQALFALAKELFTAAWLADPLDGAMAADLAEFERRLPSLSPAAAKCVAVAATLCAIRPGYQVPPRLARLEEAGDYPALRDWLRAERKLAPGNGFLAWNQYFHALANRDFQGAAAVAESLARVPALAPALAKLTADARFLAGDFDAAATAYDEAGRAFPGLCADRAGEALFRAGKKDAGRNLLRQAVADAPWMVNAALRLHDLSFGLDAKRAPLPGKTAILLYSYNNAEKLDLTLESLFASVQDCGEDVLVRALSNGAKDGTGAVIGKWKARFGEIFDGVFLPVNVGAAPARNWLASLPEVAACEFAAYLDDDVRLPKDWLSLFGTAVAERPEAGLWGCRVVDYEKPANLQQTDLNLLPPSQGDNLFSMTDAQLSAFDFGQFSYLRPASSVTGCCHLFRTKTLKASGEFDIRFSPTQYDDLDHDLRLCLSGEAIVYQGHLAVEHMKVSGRALHKSRAGSANAAANMYKLKSKYSEKDVQEIKARALTALEEDLAAKLARLGLAD